MQHPNYKTTRIKPTLQHHTNIIPKKNQKHLSHTIKQPTHIKHNYTTNWPNQTTTPPLPNKTRNKHYLTRIPNQKYQIKPHTTHYNTKHTKQQHNVQHHKTAQTQNPKYKTNIPNKHTTPTLHNQSTNKHKLPNQFTKPINKPALATPNYKNNKLCIQTQNKTHVKQ